MVGAATIATLFVLALTSQWAPHMADGALVVTSGLAALASSTWTTSHVAPPATVNILPFRVHGRDLYGADRAQYDRNVTFAQDVFLVGSCVTVLTSMTCQYPDVDFSLLTFEIRSVWGTLCTSPAGSAPCEERVLDKSERGRRRATRVVHRDGYNWSPTTILELCDPQLLGSHTSRVRVALAYPGQGGTSQSFEKEYDLSRVASAVPETGGDRSFAMTVVFRGDGWAAPAWLDVWSALGISHFYVYYNGPREALLLEDPEAAAIFESDPRVTLQIWDFPFRTVITDTTGTSKLPLVNKYGKVDCYLHFSKLTAFNSALSRYGSRHEWMGFFDFDEYIAFDDRFISAANAQGKSPLQTFFDTFGSQRGVDALVFANRWTTMIPPPVEGAPLRTGDLLARRLYAGTTGDHKTRMKYMLRTESTLRGVHTSSLSHGRLPRAPVIAGNHFACVMRDGVARQLGNSNSSIRRGNTPDASAPQHARLTPLPAGAKAVPRARRVAVAVDDDEDEDEQATEERPEMWSGACDAFVEPRLRLVPPNEAYSLHVVNMKPHVSIIDVNGDAEVKAAIDAGLVVTSIHRALHDWLEPDTVI